MFIVKGLDMFIGNVNINNINIEKKPVSEVIFIGAHSGFSLVLLENKMRYMFFVSSFSLAVLFISLKI